MLDRYKSSMSTVMQKHQVEVLYRIFLAIFFFLTQQSRIQNTCTDFQPHLHCDYVILARDFNDFFRLSGTSSQLNSAPGCSMGTSVFQAPYYRWSSCTNFWINRY